MHGQYPRRHGASIIGSGGGNQASISYPNHIISRRAWKKKQSRKTETTTFDCVDQKLKPAIIKKTLDAYASELRVWESVDGKRRANQCRPVINACFVARANWTSLASKLIFLSDENMFFLEVNSKTLPDQTANNSQRAPANGRR